jgi:hypothetical protein
MSEDQYQPYSYRPLDRSRKEIRLIFVVNQDEIQFLAETINADPEVSSDLASVRSLEGTYPVCCTIQHVSLEDKPRLGFYTRYRVLIRYRIEKSI